MISDDDIGDLTSDQLREMARGMTPEDPLYESVRRELRSLGVSEREAFGSPRNATSQAPVQVVITDIQIPFGTVMELMLKATFASIPIAIVFAIVLALLRGAF